MKEREIMKELERERKRDGHSSSSQLHSREVTTARDKQRNIDDSSSLPSPGDRQTDRD